MQGDEDIEIEPENGLYLLPVFFRTHCYNAKDKWGWSAGQGCATIVDSIASLKRKDYHEVKDVESTVVLLADPAKLFARLSVLEHDDNLSTFDLNILEDVALMAFGTSCHSGDFVWLAERFVEKDAQPTAARDRRTACP